ncbi:MAG: PQQ-binding-like beta-propeller repeat protein [candidate division Zixibacteria bacterium]|nr:PQQ-binding-like beta-propeller repeat protein [candidate division Zixibacteria bacterium]
MRRRLLFLALVLFFLTSCSSALRFEKIDFSGMPGWSSFRGDPQNTAYLSWPIKTPNKLLWRFNAKRPLKSSPILVGKILVITSLNKRVHLLDALSGKNLELYKVSSPVSTSACADGERIYFGLDAGKETFLALNIRTGELLWKRSLGHLSSSPALCSGKVFVGSTDGRLWALDKIGGESIWEFEMPSSQISTPACVVPSSPPSTDGVLCLGSADGHLYAVNMDTGGMIWKFKAEGGIYSSPAVKNGRVFFGSMDGSVYALNLEDGSLAWKFQTGADIYSSPALAESLLYIGSNDYRVYALNQKTGGLVWKSETKGLVRSSPLAAGDKVFFGSYDGSFYVLNRFTGQILWTYQTDGMISGSPGYYDGKIYIGSEDGFVYCFGP